MILVSRENYNFDLLPFHFNDFSLSIEKFEWFVSRDTFIAGSFLNQNEKKCKLGQSTMIDIFRRPRGTIQ